MTNSKYASSLIQTTLMRVLTKICRIIFRIINNNARFKAISSRAKGRPLSLHPLLNVINRHFQYHIYTFSFKTSSIPVLRYVTEKMVLIRPDFPSPLPGTGDQLVSTGVRAQGESLSAPPSRGKYMYVYRISISLKGLKTHVAYM